MTKKEVFEELIQQADLLLRDGERIKSRGATLHLAAFSLKAQQKPRWKSVTKIDLKIGNCYIVRRRTKDFLGTTTVARWTEGGWDVIYGDLYRPTGDIEVLA